MRLFALVFVAGVFLLQHQRTLPESRWALAALAVALTLGLVRRERRLVRGLLLVLCGSLAGFGYAAWRAEVRLAEALPPALENTDIEVTGIVAGLPQLTERGTRFAFEVEDPVRKGVVIPSLVSLTWYGDRGMGDAMRPPEVVAGERWRFTARLKRPRGLANPHVYDFEAWALERDLRATGYARASAAPERLAARVDGWPYTLHRWRGEVRAAMLDHLGDAALRGVLVALAIGDQDAIPAADWDVFWRTGVGHLMSISGLHITMLAALGFAVAYCAWVRIRGLALRVPARKAAVIAGVAVALAYTLMTGYAVPAQRTLAMLATVAACVLADRHGSPSRVLALAALAVVLLDPWAVLAPGFWLSFGAVASIFYAMALRTGRAGRLHGAVVEQLAVTVAMVPMLVALFQQLSLVSPIANAFAIPLVSLVVVPLTLAGAFLPLPFLLDAAHWLMSVIMAALEWLAALPLAMLEIHEPAAWVVACAVAGCAWLLAPRGFPMRSCGAIWVAPLFVVLPPRPGLGDAWVDVLDVGNGLAVVVRTCCHAFAYDAGPRWSSESDVGNRIMVPFLRGEGIERLDGLVVSHADEDHSGGAESLAESRDPPWLLSPLPPDHELHEAVERSIRCEAGQRWRWDGVDFRVLHPDAAVYSEAGGKPRKENDRGCVVKVSTDAHSMLLGADVEARGEAEMLKRDAAALASEVLLVPHHGSRTSSTPAYLAAVSPEVAIFSVGYLNRFRHPNAMVVERYRARGVEMRRTDREGALRIVLPAGDGEAVKVSGQQESCRYWSQRCSAGW